MTKNNYSYDDVPRIMLIFLIGFICGAVIVVLVSPSVWISHETANDVCFNLTNQTTYAYADAGGRLVCEVPSYDSTTNIIVRKTGETQ